MKSILALLTTLLLPALVHSEACVAGGPSFQVDDAHVCCTQVNGTWYQFYAVQAICVLDDAKTWYYERCVNSIENSVLDSTCIAGSGPIPSSILTSATGRTTISAPTAAAPTTTLVARRP